MPSKSGARRGPLPFFHQAPMPEARGWVYQIQGNHMNYSFGGPAPQPLFDPVFFVLVH